MWTRFSSASAYSRIIRMNRIFRIFREFLGTLMILLKELLLGKLQCNDVNVEDDIDNDDDFDDDDDLMILKINLIQG